MVNCLKYTFCVFVLVYGRKFAKIIYHFNPNLITLTMQLDISCRNTKQSVGNIITQSNFLTLKYVTDAWGTHSNGFKLVITAIKNFSELTLISCRKFTYCTFFHPNEIFFFICFLDHACKEVRCLSSEFCISTDLKCDGVNHCGDGSDESSPLCCKSIYTNKLRKNIDSNLNAISSSNFRCGDKYNVWFGIDVAGIIGGERIFGVECLFRRHYYLGLSFTYDTPG